MKRKAVAKGVRAWPASRAAGQARAGSGLRILPHRLLAPRQRGEADAVDEVAGAEPGRDAAAGLVPGRQGCVPGRSAEEFVHVGQREGQVGEPGLVTAAGHDCVPGTVAPNPAHAAVPGWAECASSGTVTGPPTGTAAW